MTLCIVVADGARPDTLFGAIEAGQLPALRRVRDAGSAHVISSVFPSVTGSAYTPFLMGLHPGRAGLPGLRWYDRARTATIGPAYSRSYVGIGGMRADTDLTRDHRTLFELEPRSLGGFTYIGRGLDARRRIGTGWAFGARMAWTHFRGDLAGWMRFDRWLGEEFVRRSVAQRPRVAFLAHPGVDKLSHRFGQSHAMVLDALRTVDNTVALLEQEFARAGRAEDLEIWIVSDHGHADLHGHEDLEGLLRTMGLRTRAHPWVFGGDDVAVMVSGNAMAHLYCELSRTERPGFEALRARWMPVVEALLARESVDLVLLPIREGLCEVHGRGRGVAVVRREAAGGVSALAGDARREARGIAYRCVSGDPLGLGGDVEPLCVTESWERARESDYPDALEQILAIADAPRAGDIIISASPGWDLRTRWEPIVHASGHGALHREQMLVPLLMSRPANGTPRRTVDVLPSVLAALGTAGPQGLDGESFR